MKYFDTEDYLLNVVQSLKEKESVQIRPGINFNLDLMARYPKIFYLVTNAVIASILYTCVFIVFRNMIALNV